jgi:hypothetical protein
VAGPLGRRRREHCKSFPAKPLAEAFLTTLKKAARDGTPFHTATGLPAPPRTARGGEVTWYEHAYAYSQMKWPDLAAKSRRSTAEALTTITLALTRPRLAFPDPAALLKAYANCIASTSPSPMVTQLCWSG